MSKNSFLYLNMVNRYNYMKKDMHFWKNIHFKVISNRNEQMNVNVQKNILKFTLFASVQLINPS